MKEILKKLISLKVNLEGYMLLYILSTGDIGLFQTYTSTCGKLETESVEKLISLGYITGKTNDQGKYLLSQIQLTPEGKTLFPKDEGIKEWFDTWYELWPTGVKSGGYLVKSNHDVTLKKMEKFCKENPQFTKGVIIGATKKYLGDMKNKGYGYIKTCYYYIYKDGVSVLEGFCSDMLTSVNRKEKPMGNVEVI